jgi:hypothetical protein
MGELLEILLSLLYIFAETDIFSVKFLQRQPIIKEHSMNRQHQDTTPLRRCRPTSGHGHWNAIGGSSPVWNTTSR